MVKRTRKLWSDKDESVFVHLWEKNLPDLQSERKNINVYKEMAVQLQEHDITVSPFEIKAKMEALKRKYLYEKNKKNSSDVWKHLKRIESIVGDTYANCLTYSTEESTDSSACDPNLKISSRVSKIAKPTCGPATRGSTASRTEQTTKKFRKPGKIWSTKEQNVLLYLWQENLPALQSERKNIDVYRDMVVQLQDYNVTATPSEIKSKMEALKRKYCLEKSKSGSSELTDWKHFKIMDSLIGCGKHSAVNIFDSDSDSTACESISKTGKPFTLSCELLSESSASQTEPASTKFRKPGKIWSPKEENTLIYLWQQNLPALRSQRKNIDVYSDMVVQLKKYDVTATQCEIKSKMEALKRKYCLERSKVDSTGVSEWKHFQKVKFLVDVFSTPTDSDLSVCDLIMPDCDSLINESSASETTQAASKQRKKNKTWSIKEENALIDLWQENLTEFEGERKNIVIYKEIAKQLQAQDVVVTPREIKSKMEATKKKYRKEEIMVERSGVSHWQNFEKVHSLLAPAKAMHLKYRIEESSGCDTSDCKLGNTAYDRDTTVDGQSSSVNDQSTSVNDPVISAHDQQSSINDQHSSINDQSIDDSRMTGSSTKKHEHETTVAYIKTLLCSLPYNVAEQLSFEFIAKCQEEVLKHSINAD